MQLYKIISRPARPLWAPQLRRHWLTSVIMVLLVSAACSAPRMERAMEAPAASSMDTASGGNDMAAPAAEEAAAAVDASYQDGIPLARKIVARATMTVVVDDTDAVVETIQEKLERSGGYVAAANLYRSQYGGDEQLQGMMTLRIPADTLESFMQDIEGMAVAVNDKTISREDITDQYSDVDARLRNLQATENELREMLAEVRAKPNATPEDILTVYRHLTDIRGEIEQAQGRKNMFDNLVSLSTLDLTLTPNWTTIPVVEEGWQPGRTLRNASRELVSALQDLGDAAIWLVVFLLPILVLIAIPVVVILLALRVLWRRLRKGRTRAETTEAA
ncbi:MAG: DUF4349 domain-containing protein [Caldilineaceae bacterium]|nr:DUF4349 domain-containing protein [Caldilineaceae bacterium]